MSFAYLTDSIYQRHDTGPGHPERAARLSAVWNALEEGDLLESALRLSPRAATPEEIALCHDERYIALAEREVRAGASQLSTGDTQISPASYDVALRAVGGLLTMTDAVLTGSERRGFCAIRPPGHHARPAQGMGFCLFNNIAVAARYAQKKHGVERVAIVDWDVHHGNGTQDIFYEDGSVFFFSTHQSPWYPGTGDARETGAGSGKGSTLNRPFAAGAGRAQILGAFVNDFLPLAREFRPELVLISAGFDSRFGDPLGQFRLTDEDFAELTRVVIELAEETADGRVASVLEGGYSLEGLAAAARAHCSALNG